MRELKKKHKTKKTLFTKYVSTINKNKHSNSSLILHLTRVVLLASKLGISLQSVFAPIYSVSFRAASKNKNID